MLTGLRPLALLIAIVGVAGVLAFSVSARTREFGVRLAIGSTPRALRAGVLRDGVRIAAIGIAAGAAGGYALVRVAEALFGGVQLPGALPVIGAAAVLIGAATAASLMPAARASRVDASRRFGPSNGRGAITIAHRDRLRDHLPARSPSPFRHPVRVVLRRGAAAPAIRFSPRISERSSYRCAAGPHDIARSWRSYAARGETMHTTIRGLALAFTILFTTAAAGAAAGAAASGQTPSPDAAASKAANPELVGMITKEVGVTQAQAEGGAGALLGLAKSRLSADEFGKVSSAIPGTDALLEAAPAAGGAAGALGSLAGGASGLGAVAGSFSKLGLTPDAAAKMAPVLLKYVNGKGATEAASLLGRALK